MASPAYLLSPTCATERNIEDALARSMFDADALRDLQTKRLEYITRFWSKRGCTRSRDILAKLSSADSLCVAMSDCQPRRRVSDSTAMPVTCELLTIRTIRTSGSSGMPLAYGVSQSWRFAHNSAWRLAYRHMTSGWLKGYLDPAVKWAMMRTPGGTSDSFDHVINCVPINGDLTYSQRPEDVNPAVVHGSITTLLQAMEDDRVRNWTPRMVILAYEGSFEWQRRLVSCTWPMAFMHEEYGANDGGASAFTCPFGKLHFWSNRSLPFTESIALRVADLWNTAESFICYECGDEVEWDAENCSCTCVLPTMHLRGRVSGKIVLDNGAVISALCPFDSETMENVRAVRVLVGSNNSADVILVEQAAGGCRQSRMENCLLALGFERVNFSFKRSVSELRLEKAKFQTVVDNRNRAAGPENL